MGRLIISGNNASRVFFLKLNSVLTLDGVTVTGGNGIGATNTSFNNNRSSVYIDGGRLTLNNTTVSGNTANKGGGITSFEGSTTLRNLTISGYTGTTSGGIAAFCSDFGSASVSLTNVTVTDNRATSTISVNCAGGINNGTCTLSAASVTLRSTIVAGNTVAATNVLISMTGSNSETRAVLTDSLGYYLFDEAEAGQTYIVSASRKRYHFIMPMQVLFAGENLTEVDFTILLLKRMK